MSPRKHTQIITKTAATFSFCKEKYNCLVEVLYSQLTKWVNLMGVLRVWVGQLMVLMSQRKRVRWPSPAVQINSYCAIRPSIKSIRNALHLHQGIPVISPKLEDTKNTLIFFSKFYVKVGQGTASGKLRLCWILSCSPSPVQCYCYVELQAPPSTRCGRSKSTQAATQATETAPKSYRLRGKQGIEASPLVTQGTIRLVSFLPPSPKEL